MKDVWYEKYQEHAREYQRDNTRDHEHAKDGHDLHDGKKDGNDEVYESLVLEIKDLCLKFLHNLKDRFPVRRSKII